ncbi:MAG: hypothetical protein LW875_03940 [Proteobacteria bacterium]|nr:hypothetical protein [Pseudomonadota bacterium]
MFQKIIETNEFQDLTIHTLESGALIAGFEVDIFDEELFGLEKTQAMLRSLIKDLPLGRTLRIYLKSQYSTESIPDISRSKALSEVGFVKNRAFIFLEKPVDINFKNILRPKKENPTLEFLSLKEKGIKVSPLNKNQIESLFPDMKDEINHSFQTIDLGAEVLSLIRLTKQTEFGIDLSTLSHIKDSLPLPYTICCSIQAMSQAESEAFLRRRFKQTSLMADQKEVRVHTEAQSDLEDISLNGVKLFKFEWQCLVTRNQESELRHDREEIRRKLEPLGEMYIESVGALQSLKSFFPGTSPHFTLIEKDQTLCSYMPLISRGDARSEKSITQKSLSLHRKDETLCFIDVFNPKYESYSWCIFGRPGTGKSVITNAITRALINDPQIKVIKIDVGGSHSRETESLGGVEKVLSLNEPTGINPFHVLKELGPTKEALQILASFLEVLILEEGETKLSKTLKSELERKLQLYSELGFENMSLEHFYSVSQDLPRKELLQRWVGRGVYGNAFAPLAEKPSGPQTRGLDISASLSDLRSSRLFYYNFSKISQALDPDYAQGGLAAVMAQFNLEMLKKSKDKKKIVFIADETPFFIKKCFSFFNLSIANVRKEGHGFITIAQKSSHVVVDGDTGILDNSPNRIYFSHDGDEDSFISRNQLTKESLEVIKELKRKQGEFSECLLKDNFGERVIRIRLSPEEYWAFTSKDEDRQKFQELKLACPNLTTEEITRCLALS